MDVGKDFFAFVTLVALLMVAIAVINRPTAVTNIINGFNSILSNLKTTPA